MSAVLSILIASLVVLNILACLWLLYWTSKKRAAPSPELANTGSANSRLATTDPATADPATTDPATTGEPETTGHIWDGDLREYNNPLPKWWLNMFYLTIAFAVVYLIVYPGLGNYTGYFRWSSAHEHDLKSRAERELYLAAFTPLRELSFADLRNDARAQKLAQSMFSTNCSACHGSDAQGAKGFPNLRDADWIYGDEPETVMTTIRDGRQAAMPPWQAVLGENGVKEVVAYVQQRSGQPSEAALASAGKARFDMFCMACHGPDGKGNKTLGAPNLTDAIWLYGGDAVALSESIGNGRNGVMPSQKAILNEDQIRVLAAWVIAKQAVAAVPINATP
jgi:cytochrome c oxidase cbb3-type subunit III